ncbi:MAG: TIGR01841 family phasin [Proteobacteria bacterium]|nr:TIGR01841 family phasin [Pseudomonadota bacterium]
MATRKTAATKTSASAAKPTAKTAGAAGASDAATSTPRAFPGLRALDLRNYGKLAEQLKLPGVDLNAILESQRKDMEALAEANRQAYEGMKQLAARRNEILRESLAEWQQAMRDAGGEEAIKRHTKAVQDGVKKAVENFRELAQMEAATRSKAWKVVQDRFQENLAAMQKLLRQK